MLDLSFELGDALRLLSGLDAEELKLGGVIDVGYFGFDEETELPGSWLVHK